MCRAGTGPDGRPIHADIAIMGLATGAIDGDRELGDVTVRNFAGGFLILKKYRSESNKGIGYNHQNKLHDEL